MLRGHLPVFHRVGADHFRSKVPCKKIYESAFPGSVASYDAYFFISLEIVCEMVQIAFVTVVERYILAVYYFGPETRAALYFRQRYLLLGICPGRPVFQIIECIDAVSGLSRACLRRTAHPFEFAAQDVADLVCLCIVVGYPFIALFQIVFIVSPVGIYGTVVHFHDYVADMVQKIPVVGHHQQGAARPGQIVFKEFYRIDV